MTRRSWVALGSVLFISAAYACSSNDQGSSSSTTSTSGSAAGGSHSGGAGGTGSGFTDHGAIVSLVVTPPNQTIDVQSGATASATFSAVATFADNTTGNVDATWSFDTLPIASTNQMGVVTANGSAGGHGTVTATTTDGKSATAGVDVMLHITQNLANLSTSDIGLFASPDTVPSGTLLYPYDKTVFAQGLLSPELQWSGGVVGDSYSVHLVGKYVDAQLYVAADPPSRFSIPQDVWTAVTQSTNGGDTTLDIERLSSGSAHLAMHESWTIAKGNLRGSIYYWSVNTGQLQKIAPGAANPTVIFDSGAADQLGTPTPAAYDGTTPPWSSGGNNKRCVACHTVSKDGSTIAAVFEKNGSTASPWGTVDLTTAPPAVTQITPYTSNAIYLGLTPDGKYGVENDVNLTMHLADAKTGAGIPSALDSFSAVADPAFSPDGTLFAFSSNVVGAYPVEFTSADLDVMDFNQATTTFSNRRTIAHGGTSEIAFASFSPDSKWAFFQMGDYSRAKYGAAGNLTGHNDLYMTDLAGTVGELSLANASGASLEARNQHRSYQPTVNPIAVGGYTWVVFVSPRDYGNEMQSTSDATIENRKQLWVAAIDTNPQPGVDPSHPAFWLPGQDLTTINMSGYWALEACHQQGTSCDQGFECCTGFCQDDGMGNKSCVPPPGGCSNEGDKCVSASDCCNPAVLSCIGGFCAPSAPPN